MDITFIGVTFTLSRGGFTWDRLPDVKRLDDEPKYCLGHRLELLERGKVKVYRYTQFPDRDMKFGWLLEIPEVTYRLGARDNAYL